MTVKSPPPLSLPIKLHYVHKKSTHLHRGESTPDVLDQVVLSGKRTNSLSSGNCSGVPREMQLILKRGKSEKSFRNLALDTAIFGDHCDTLDFNEQFRAA